MPALRLIDQSVPALRCLGFAVSVSVAGWLFPYRRRYRCARALSAGDCSTVEEKHFWSFRVLQVCAQSVENGVRVRVSRRPAIGRLRLKRRTYRGIRQRVTLNLPIRSFLGKVSIVCKGAAQSFQLNWNIFLH